MGLLSAKPQVLEQLQQAQVVGWPEMLPDTTPSSCGCCSACILAPWPPDNSHRLEVEAPVQPAADEGWQQTTMHVQANGKHGLPGGRMPSPKHEAAGRGNPVPVGASQDGLDHGDFQIPASGQSEEAQPVEQ